MTYVKAYVTSYLRHTSCGVLLLGKIFLLVLHILSSSYLNSTNDAARAHSALSTAYIALSPPAATQRNQNEMQHTRPTRRERDTQQGHAARLELTHSLASDSEHLDLIRHTLESTIICTSVSGAHNLYTTCRTPSSPNDHRDQCKSSCAGGLHFCQPSTVGTSHAHVIDSPS